MFLVNNWGLIRIALHIELTGARLQEQGLQWRSLLQLTVQVSGINLSDRTLGIIEKRRSLYLRKAPDCGRSLMKSYANYLNGKDTTLKNWST